MNENQIRGKLLALNMRKEEAEDKVNKARNVIFWVAGLNLLAAVFAYWSAKLVLVLIFGSAISILLAGLGFWAKKSPLPALITSFSILTVLFGLEFINLGQMSLISVASRIAVLLILAIGIYNIIWANRILKEYNELAQSVRA